MAESSGSLLWLCCVVLFSDGNHSSKFTACLAHCRSGQLTGRERDGGQGLTTPRVLTPGLIAYTRRVADEVPSFLS